MKTTLVIIAGLLLIGCSTAPTGPAAQEQHKITVIVDVPAEYNPWKDLYVIAPPDSIIRAYPADTVDTITVQHGTELALLYYRDGIREQQAWDTLIVTSDTNVYFNNRIKYY